MAGHYLAQMLSFELDSEHLLLLGRSTINDIQKTASTLPINHIPLEQLRTSAYNNSLAAISLSRYASIYTQSRLSQLKRFTIVQHGHYQGNHQL